MAAAVDGMNVERDTVIEAVMAVVPGLLAVLALYVLGGAYVDDGGLSSEGGTVVVGIVVAFVLALTAIGLVRARSD